MKLAEFDNPITGKSERLSGETIWRYILGVVIMLGVLFVGVFAWTWLATVTGLKKLGGGLIPGIVAPPPPAHADTSAPALTVLQ